MTIGNVIVGKAKCDIKIKNGKIAEICPAGASAEGDYVDMGGRKAYPGLIDIHIHGAVGDDTMDGRLNAISDYLAENGVTSWLPTTMTAPMDELRRLTSSLPSTGGAQVLGYHMEGPFISPEYAGAQNPEHISNMYEGALDGFENIKMITVAPELDGAIPFIKECEPIVCIGHTGCDYDTAIKAIDAGAACLTHTFNAMKPLLHREPGPIGAAAERHVYAQLICDGIHVHKAAVLALYQLFGWDRLVLISDSMRATGLDDGVYDLGGQDMTVKEGVARTADGKLAGSTTNLLGCVKKAISFGIPEHEAFKMASLTPAQLLGLNKGRLEAGYDADILIVDDDLTPYKVIIGGKCYN